MNHARCIVLASQQQERAQPMSDVRDVMMVGRRTDGTPVRRPLSPHLQVYRPQLTSVLSILNRMSGVVSAVGTLLMVWWLVAAASSPHAFATASGFIGSWFGMLLMLGWTAAMFYHLFAGLRHLAWDSGYGWKLPEVYASGWAVVIATAAATVLVWGAGAVVLIWS
jgi:succinate dehydrogenase / fumarate reductase, cytochrome b subunit